jgi:hypothetical protein
LKKLYNDFDNVDLFYEVSPRGRGQFLNFKRFESLGAALKYAVEELGPGLPCMSIEMGEVELDRRQIFELYDNLDFPLEREFRQQRAQPA